MNHLNNKNGELVLYNELIGSRAGSIESKHKSERKAGRDDHIADANANLHAGCLFGMHLRVSGEMEQDNELQLFERLPIVRSA